MNPTGAERLPPEWPVEDMGEVGLRGKSAPIRLLALA
jgi:hypothetical protein